MNTFIFPFTDEDFEILKKLGNHQILAKWRGNLTPEQRDFLFHMLSNSESPSDFRKKWQEFMSNFQVIGNLLKQHERDGKTEIKEELTSALDYQSYIFPGQKLREKELQPVTFIILEPDKTLQLVNFLNLELHWFLHISPYSVAKNKFRYKNDKRFKTEQGYHNLLKKYIPLFKKLIQTFPILGEIQNWHDMSAVSRYLRAAYQIEIVEKFKTFSKATKDFSFLPQTYYNNEQKLQFTRIFNSRKDCIKLHGFLFGIKGTADNVLKYFSEEEIKKIAFWQINIPHKLLESFYSRLFFSNIKIQLYSAEEHEYWKKLYPTLTSTNSNNNQGITINIPTVKGCSNCGFIKHKHPFTKSRFIFRMIK